MAEAEAAPELTEAELREKLAKSEESRLKLRAALNKLKPSAQTALKAASELPGIKQKLKAAEQGLQEAKEVAAEEQQQRLMAEQAATAAEAAARVAEAAATRSAAAAQAAQADAAEARRQLREVQAQLARLQAACDANAAAVRQQEQQALQAKQAPDALAGPAAAALQGKVEQVAAELNRWRAALAFLVSGAPISSLGNGAPLPQLPNPAPALQPASPQKQRRGRKAAAAVPAPAVPPPPQEDARAKAVRQVAARQAEQAAAAATAATGTGTGASAAAAKRSRPAAAAGGAAAGANVFAEALGNLESGRPGAKRAKLAAQQAKQAGPAGGASLMPPPLAPAVPAEASLAVSANAQPERQAQEHPAAADEAAQLLGRITAAAAPGGTGLSLEAVKRVAADLHFRLAENRLPLLLLLRCFETAVLDSAAPAPQGRHLQHGTPAAAAAAGQEIDAGAAARLAAEALPDAWFEASDLDADMASSEQEGERRRDLAGAAPYAAVWCKREALAGRHLPWLLHCAAEIQRLHGARAAAAAALAAVSGDARQQPSSGGQGLEGTFAAALQRHLHREVLSWCLAASLRGSGDGGSGGGGGGRVRHTETEACALAAAAAALCRMSGNAEEFWALLLDLLTCPAAPATVLPPLAAAIDVWPAAITAATARSGTVHSAADSAADTCVRGGLATGFHAALQRLCGQVAEAEAPTAGESPEQQRGSACSGTAEGHPPPLLLERQPAAAVVYLRQLGETVWRWQDGAAECGEKAAHDLLAAAAEWRAGPATAGAATATAAAALAGLAASAAPNYDAAAAAGLDSEVDTAANAPMPDVEVEEI